MEDRQITGYPNDPQMKRERLEFVTYEYDMPFNYPNITVWRKDMRGNEFHGVELATQNAGAPTATMKGVPSGSWTPLHITLTVPPEAVSAVCMVNIGDMAPDETLWIADAFAGVVPDDWEEGDAIPAGAINLVANPAFAGGPLPPDGWRIESPGGGGATGGFIPPAGWRSDLSSVGDISHQVKDEKNRAGLMLRRAALSLFTEFSVEPGRSLSLSLWARSTRQSSPALRLSCKMKRKDGLILCDKAGDAIIITEDEPIVRVVVIGSACTPPGYVMLEAEPCEEFYRRGDMVRCTAPARFKQTNLWGMHMRIDQWRTWALATPGYEDIPEGFVDAVPILEHARVKSHYSEVPLAGMSCAAFDIPKSRKVTIMGGSESPVWQTDNCSDDDHYSFRTIRTTLVVGGTPCPKRNTE